MSTDYDSPPHQEPFRRSKIQNKRVYGKKGKRAIAGTSQNAESLRRNREGERESSSEGDAMAVTVTQERGRAQTRVAAGAKGKGKARESAWEESETGTTSSSGSIVVSHSIKKGKSARPSRLPTLRRQPQIDPQPSASTASRASSASYASSTLSALSTGGSRPAAQGQASSSKVVRYDPFPTPRRKSTASPASRSSLRRARKISVNEQENLEAVLPRRRSQKTSIESSSKNTNQAFPLSSSTTDLQVYRAATISVRSSTLSDKSNIPKRSGHPSHSVTPVTDSPPLTDLPPTLPRFTRQYSTRLSFSRAQSTSFESPKSTSKIAIIKDSIQGEPLALPSTSLLPSLPVPLGRSPSTSHMIASTSSASTSQFLRSPPPKFQFTTTIFENSTSFTASQLELGLRGDDRIGNDSLIVEGKEGDGMGMDSTFVLESFCEEESRIGKGVSELESEIDAKETSDEAGVSEVGGGSAQENVEVAIDDQEKNDTTVEMERATAGQFADESNSTIRDDSTEKEIKVYNEEKEVAQPEAEHLVPREVKIGDTDSTTDEGLGEKGQRDEGTITRDQIEAVQEQQNDTHEYEFCPPSLEELSLAESLISSSTSSVESHALKSPSMERTYDADHLPPRRPRSPRYIENSPRFLSQNPPSDEDDLAYLIRTTATHSSEDDLPPIPSDYSSDERNFELAEREIGRGVKTTSRQRDKRVGLREGGRGKGGGYLRIGEGKEGRRSGWKREIVEVDKTVEEIDEGELGEDELELKSEVKEEDESG